MTREELKQIIMLGYLTDDMIDQLIPITDLLLFDDKEVVFRQGDKADRFYMLQQGKVLLEQRITDKITISLSSIKPGYSFGWSAMLEDKLYAYDAICAEPCRVYSFRENKIKELFEKNHSMGFIISQRLLRIIKNRYDIQKEQFIKTLTHHPDLSDLFDNTD